MNFLSNYDSDDDLDNSSDEKGLPAHQGSSKNTSGRRYGSFEQDDTNYDEVQMSLSEDSNDESKSSDKGRNSPRSKDDRRKKEKNDRDSRDRYSVREKRDEDRNGTGSKEEDRDRGKRGSSSSRCLDKGRSNRDRDRYKSEDRGRRDEKRGRSKERYSSRDNRHGRDSRDTRERDRRRSRSPRDDRKRSRSRSPRRDRTRSRSRSKDRTPRRFPLKRFDRGGNRPDRNERLSPGFRKDETTDNSASDDNQPKDRFFVPGITGRFRDQIEKRKQLWQKKDPEQPTQGNSSATPQATKVWEATTFAQDTDGKVANKFKRLMGIKSVGEGSKPATEVLKKQEEMFSSMEQQYEVARTATHTMRGVGLGFGSYQR